MTGLEFLRASGTTVEEIADVISSPCPPVIPEKCDRLSCRECWIAWLTTGKAPLNADSEKSIDLAPLRRLQKGELSGLEPEKPWSKEVARINKGSDSEHLQ